MQHLTFIIFLTVTIFVIFSQTIHTYFVFHSFSKIKNNKLKEFQAIMFCSVLSLGILGYVLKGKPEMAAAGAVIEFIINVYYYALRFWEDGYKQFAGDAALPAFLYFFAEELK